MKKCHKKGEEADQKSPKTLVKVYNLILTFDTDVPNDKLSKEIDLVIAEVNRVLSKNMKDSLPYIFKDDGKESKVSISYNKEDE
jgi:hypothetical protein